MKLRTYVVTLMAFSMFHALRISFSFNKNQIQLKYDVDDLFLSIMDVLNFIMYAVGSCFHFVIVDRKNLKQFYLKICILASLSGSFFAYFSLFFQDHIVEDPIIDKIIKKGVLVINICLFGFSSFSTWPINLSLVSQYYKPQKDGAMIGIWGSGWQIGNILSFLVSNFLIYSLKIRWEVTVLIFAITNLLAALMIYFLLKNPTYHYIQPEQKQSKEEQIVDKNSKNISLNNNENESFSKADNPSQFHQSTEVIQKRFVKYIRNLLKSKQVRVYIIINGITSTIFNFFLFWIPIYMVSINYQNIPGYVTLIFEVFAIVGSFFLGMFHEESINVDKSSTKNLKAMIFENIPFIATGINILTLLIWLIIQQNILVYAIMIAILGFCMGGLFNSMHSNDLFIYTENDPLKTEMFAVLILITNYIITALGFLVLGFFIKYGHQMGLINPFQSQYKCLIHVSLIITAIKLGLFILRRHYSNQKPQITSQQNKNPLDQ